MNSVEILDKTMISYQKYIQVLEILEDAKTNTVENMATAICELFDEKPNKKVSFAELKSVSKKMLKHAIKLHHTKNYAPALVNIYTTNTINYKIYLHKFLIDYRQC